MSLNSEPNPELIEKRLEKTIERVAKLEKHVAKLADTLGVMDERLRKVGVVRDINYMG